MEVGARVKLFAALTVLAVLTIATALKDKTASNILSRSDTRHVAGDHDGPLVRMGRPSGGLCREAE